MMGVPQLFPNLPGWWESSHQGRQGEGSAFLQVADLSTKPLHPERASPHPPARGAAAWWAVCLSSAILRVLHSQPSAPCGVTGPILDCSPQKPKSIRTQFLHILGWLWRVVPRSGTPAHTQARRSCLQEGVFHFHFLAQAPHVPCLSFFIWKADFMGRLTDPGAWGKPKWLSSGASGPGSAADISSSHFRIVCDPDLHSSGALGGLEATCVCIPDTTQARSIALCEGTRNEPRYLPTSQPAGRLNSSRHIWTERGSVTTATNKHKSFMPVAKWGTRESPID